MSRKLEDLHPEVHWRAKNVLQMAKNQGIDILVYRTLSTFAEQQAIYDQGRTTPGPKCKHDGKTFEIGECLRHPLGLIISNAKAGESYHDYGLAFDYCIDIPGPGVSWDSAIDLDDDQIPDYREVGEIGEDLGLQWGGRFKELKGDYGHLQCSFGFKISELLAFYQVGGMARVWTEIAKELEKNKWP